MQRLPLLLAALLLALVPTAVAVEPEDAPALWRQAYGDDAVLNVTFLPGDVQAGDQFAARITFDPTADVALVKYQICEVGKVCFAIGAPTQEVESGVWELQTEAIAAYVGAPQPPTFDAGRRYGVQFMVYREGFQNDTDFDWFPQADECAYDLSEEDWIACNELHYFAITVQEAAKGSPGPAVPILLAALAAVAWARRRHA